ncbi:MAG: DnaJ domain-containing protein [Clostridia bacterium]|nr:DnaJ domain-containing protein [Clostridia bacterium]
MNNPYEYLGVSRNATEKDIMDAYRRIAGEITNANIPDSEKTQRMNELNNAYDTILNDLRGTTNYAGNQNNNYNGNSQFSDVRQCINSGRLDDAETILNGVPSYMISAEWHYLKGVIHQRRGWLNEAYNCYQTACSMDPYNQEYKAAFNSLNNNANGGYRTTRKSSDGDVCNICSGLLCADCCCECCGGDLIPCC